MRTAIVVLAFLAIFGCGEDEGFNDICEPGRSVVCVGPGGCSGAQVCVGGTSWSICDCGSTDAGADADADVEAAVEADADGDSYDGTDDGLRPDDAIRDEAPSEDSTEVPTCYDVDCYDGDPCTVDRCIGGACTNLPAVDGTRCPSGVCYDGACCNGCWTGDTCIPFSGSRNNPVTCGVEGESCSSCDDGDPCTQNRCGAGDCDYSYAAEYGTPCPGGECRLGDCVELDCGYDYEACCPGRACLEGTCVGYLGDICRVCGAENLPCCPTAPGCDPPTTPGDWLICNSTSGLCMRI